MGSIKIGGEWPWSKTFPPFKRGVPSGKKIIPRPITDRKPPKITKEDYFFITGTNWRDIHIHTDRCAEQCTDCKCKQGE